MHCIGALGRYASTGLSFTTLALLLVDSAECHPNPINVLTDLAESRKSILNVMLVFIGQTELHERCVVANSSYVKV